MRPLGNCYEIANLLAGWGPNYLKAHSEGFGKVHDDIDALTASGLDWSKAVAVHGFPTLQRPPFKPYGHAWVEIGDTVIDASRYPATSMPKDAYYALGKIDADDATRYGKSELRANLGKHEHWGPWADSSKNDSYLMAEDKA